MILISPSPNEAAGPSAEDAELLRGAFLAMAQDPRRPSVNSEVCFGMLRGFVRVLSPAGLVHGKNWKQRRRHAVTMLHLCKSMFGLRAVKEESC